MPTLTFQQGLNGYSGTFDTSLRQSAPTINQGSATSLFVDSDTPSGTGQDEQTLLRFDGLFGTGGVPAGATITKATLTLQTTNAGDGAALHRMLTSWDEASTWNSLGSGIQANGTEAVAPADRVTSRTAVGASSFDVTSSVQAWANGAANNGWAFLPSGPDGWDFLSSEGATRPKLMIEYTTGTTPTEPTEPTQPTTPTTPTSGYRLKYEGVNFGSGAFNPVDGANGRDVLNKHYTYVTKPEIDYFVSEGMNTFRLAVHANNLLNSHGADDRAIVEDLMKHAATKGATVILDVHDFGRTMSGRAIADAATIAEFANEWKQLALEYKDEPNVIFGLMNEPSSRVTLDNWLLAANAAIKEIRDTGATQMILVDGKSSWNLEGADRTKMLGIQDPLKNYTYEMHRYLDADRAGDSPDVAPGFGSITLQKQTQWARENDVKLFFGEFGFGPDAASLAEGKALNDFVHANADVYEGQAFWAAGPWWPDDYFLNLQPTGLGTDHVVDKPQMSVLDDYLLHP